MQGLLAHVAENRLQASSYMHAAGFVGAAGWFCTGGRDSPRARSVCAGARGSHPILAAGPVHRGGTRWKGQRRGSGARAGEGMWRMENRPRERCDHTPGGRSSGFSWEVALPA